MPKTTNAYWLMGAALILLLAFGLRAHNISALPPFNDESHHIRRAETVWTFADPDLSFTVGKLLTYYWYGLFDAERLHAIHITRTATALFILLSIAGTIASAKRLFGKSAANFAGLMLAFAPFSLFFDRMALTDPITAALGAWVIWSALLMAAYPHKLRYGLLTGCLLALTLLAKLTGVAYVLIPIWALLCYAPQHGLKNLWRAYHRSLIACYGLSALILTPFIARIIYKELSGQRISVVDNHLINSGGFLDTLQNNLGHLWEASWRLNSPALTIGAIVLIALALILRPNRALIYVLGCLGLIWGVTLALSGILSTRYLVLGLPPFFMLVVGALWQTLAGLRLKRGQIQLISAGIIGLWIAAFAAPFIQNAWTDPLKLNMSDRSRWEYYTNFTAGYGLMEAAADLPSLPPSDDGLIPVLGLLGSCHQMRLYLPEVDPVRLACLEFGWSGEFMPQIAATIAARAETESALYLLVEPDLPYTDLGQITTPHEVIRVYERPFNGMRVELWRVVGD